jgi:subtilisin-like proprotein convertase family protein
MKSTGGWIGSRRSVSESTHAKKAGLLALTAALVTAVSAAAVLYTAEVPVKSQDVPKSMPEPEASRPMGGGIEAVEAILTAESCSPADSTLSAGERVTVSLGLKNSGGAVGNIIGTLTNSSFYEVSGPQSYGSIPADSNTVVFRSFSFIVDPEDFNFCGGNFFFSLALQDGTTSLGSAFFEIPRGAPGGAANVYSTGSIAVAIPDLATVNIPITVPDTGTISDVNVRLRLNHTFDDDLSISLVHPSGTIYPLSARRGGSSDNFGSGTNSCAGTPTIFDASSAISIRDGIAPFAGTFRPEESSLNDARNRTSNGTWNLRIVDNAAQDVGTVGCVTLEINRTAPVCCKNAQIAVTNTLDSGAGSFRQALLTSNTRPGADTIVFSVPGTGVQTIPVGPTALPLITDPVFINGASQPGYSTTPLIEVNGAGGPPGGRGLDVTSVGCRIRALAINRFSASAIALRGGGGHKVWGCHLGTNPAGTAALPNGTGLLLAEGTTGNDIGYACGGAAPNPNIMSGNTGYGILTNPPASNNFFSGNRIGTNLAATGSIPNNAGGVFMDGTDNYMTASDCGPGNTIAFNGGAGVFVGTTGRRIQIDQNSIFSNGGLGIDLFPVGVTPNDQNDADTGANDLLNYPEIIAARASGATNLSVDVTITAPPGFYEIYFYGSDQCDPSGFGEGRTPLGSTFISPVSSPINFNNIIVAAPPPGQFLTATLVGQASPPPRPSGNQFGLGNTSEFSPCVRNSPGALTLNGSTASVNEGNAGQQLFPVTISRQNGSVGAVTQPYTLGGGTAAGGSACTAGVDYINTPGTVTFQAGQISANISIPICGDVLQEANETFNVTLSSPTGGATPGAITAAVISIIDDDSTCRILPIAYGESAAGRITNATCIIGNDRADLFTFSGVQGQRISIKMASSQFFTALSLVDPANNVQSTILDDDRSDSSFPGTGFYTLPLSGVYTIRARAPGSGTGDYVVSLYLNSQPSCAYTFAQRTNAVAAGGPYSFFIYNPPGCPPADTPSAFGSIYSGLTYRNGLVQFNVDPNPNQAARTGVIMIGSQAHLINQYGLAVPANNNFANAEPISGAASNANFEEALPDIPNLPNAPALGYNTGATGESGDPIIGGIPVRSVWYSWTAPAGSNSLYSFTTSGSSFDTVMAIYLCPASGACTLANMTRVGFNDDTINYDKTSKVNFRAIAGRRYMIDVDGKNGATGTIQLSWRPYERLFRLYLQNFNGFPSQIVPTSITATNAAGTSTAPTMFVSPGVYEFSLPLDNSAYTVNIQGPDGITWGPNGITLSNLLAARPEEADGDAPDDAFSQNVVSRPDDTPARFFIAYITNVAQSAIGQLGVNISFERGPNGMPSPNARPAMPCTPGATSLVPPFTILRENLVTYRCPTAPQTYHDIIPNMPGRSFTAPLRDLDYFVQGGNAVETEDRAMNASNAPTFTLSGRVSQVVSDTALKLTYRPAGVASPVIVRPEIAPNGDYIVRNLPPNIQYTLTAEGSGLTYIQPAPFTPAVDTTINITTLSTCTYTTPPIGPVPGTRTDLEIPVTTGPECAWSAATSTPWIVVNSAQIIGSDRVQLTIMPNPDPTTRTGTFRIQNRPDAITITQQPGGSIAGEGDVVDGTGNPTGGDGVLANDIVVLRRFVLGDFTIASPSQFQRADCAPREPATNTYGDGLITAGDVTVARLYVLGSLPPTPAAGPTVQARSEEESEKVDTAGAFGRFRRQPNPMRNEITLVRFSEHRISRLADFIR